MVHFVGYLHTSLHLLQAVVIFQMTKHSGIYGISVTLNVLIHNCITGLLEIYLHEGLLRIFEVFKFNDFSAC